MRNSLIRLASNLEKGSPARIQILNGLMTKNSSVSYSPEVLSEIKSLAEELKKHQLDGTFHNYFTDHSIQQQWLALDAYARGYAGMPSSHYPPDDASALKVLEEARNTLPQAISGRAEFQRTYDKGMTTLKSEVNSATFKNLRPKTKMKVPAGTVIVVFSSGFGSYKKTRLVKPTVVEFYKYQDSYLNVKHGIYICKREGTNVIVPDVPGLEIL
jgi:hypothetical protein